MTEPELTALARLYARSIVTPLYQGDETPTPWERGQLRLVEQAFLAGAHSAESALLAETDTIKAQLEVMRINLQSVVNFEAKKAAGGR